MDISLKRNQIIEQEGNVFPSNTYREMILEPAYHHAKKNFLEPMIQIHFAHAIMLVEAGILSKEEGVKIAKAISEIDQDRVQGSDYDPRFEDLFFQIEHFLMDKAGEVAGNLHIARSRNDMGMTIYRIVLREKMLQLIQAAIQLRENLIELTEEHIDTIMIGYTHTQQAQPTTLGHYFNAMTDVLTRDIQRFQAAFQTVNKSSMGAAALTTSGFPIQRKRMVQLLGFEDMVENSWDAVCGVDYIGESATSVQLAAINLGRSIQDLLVWGTQEFGVFKLSSPYVQISSIMPQKQNPVSIEHMRAILSSVVGDSQTVLMMMHNTPFGDIVDTEDDMQPYIWNAIDRLGKVYHLLSAVLMTMKVNKDRLLKRAKTSFANVTELADTIVRKDHLPFRIAHKIVSSTVKELSDSGKDSLEHLTLERLNKHAQQIIGKTLTLSTQQLKHALSPEHFIHVRKVEGGPNKDTMKQAIASRRHQQEKLEKWLKEKEEKVKSGEKEIDKILSDWEVDRN